MRQWAALAAILLGLLCTPLARADGVALVLAGDGEAYAEFSGAFQKSLAGSGWKVVPRAEAQLVVTAGAGALNRELASGGGAPVLATLLPRAALEKELRNLPRGGRRLTGIWLDQPLGRQVDFIRRLLPEVRRVGVLFSQDSALSVHDVRQFVERSGLSLESEESETDNTLLPALNLLLPRVDVLLALPDATLYNRENIRTLLATTYRYRRPLIGYSAALIKAGALGAVFSTPAQIARQAAELVAAGLPLPPPGPPRYFDIAVNESVAQGLDLSIADADAVRSALLGGKGKP